MRKLGVVMVLFSSPCFSTQVQGTQPYIDYLKRENSLERPKKGQSYIDILKEGATSEGDVPRDESYLENLRMHHPKHFQREPVGSFIEEEKQKLENKSPVSAIDAVKAGRSELDVNRSGKVRFAAGLKLGPAFQRQISAASDVQLRPFSEVYGQNWAPEIGFLGEYQFLRNEWVGSVGVFTAASLGYFHGNGTFRFQLRNQGGVPFSTESKTTFQFFTVPLSAGLSFRFSLLRYLRPFIMAGPSAIAYIEARSDSRKGSKGFSRGYFLGAGVSVLLDWISRGSAWDLYADNGIKHYYLNIEYTRLGTIASDVSIVSSGLSIGLSFEF